MTSLASSSLLGRRGMLPVSVTARSFWRVPVVVLDVRSRYGLTDLLVAQPGVDRPSLRDGSAVWVEARRVDLERPASPPSS